VLEPWSGFVRQADLYIAVLEVNVLNCPHIGRQVQPDAVVVSAAGCRIDEHLEQWPAQASREPAMPDPPEADPEATSQVHHTE
jgi:hypothetical protein